ncbi:phosphatidylserine decarboxylase [Flavobacteriaceae bacterium]|nr:phosphatidylserine decarboxylase [Flavobacteriaceae bacterium]
MKNILSDIQKVILVPIHKEGWKFITIFTVVTLILAMINSYLGILGIVLTSWCIFFFRNPERFIPTEEGVIVSPGDGKVNSIEKNVKVPEEFDFDKSINWVKVSIFLNVFNVHVNRVPIEGKVERLFYKKGEFLSANSDEASDLNERQSVLLKVKNDKTVIFAQVAGLVARRIICDLEEKQEVKTGDIFGIIRFGSRVDVYLKEEEIKLKVIVGQTMIGGETVIAEFV